MGDDTGKPRAHVPADAVVAIIRRAETRTSARLQWVFAIQVLLVLILILAAPLAVLWWMAARSPSPELTAIAVSAAGLYVLIEALLVRRRATILDEEIHGLLAEYAATDIQTDAATVDPVPTAPPLDPVRLQELAMKTLRIAAEIPRLAPRPAPAADESARTSPVPG